ncbi:opacity protein-like surface antigen [Roseinatronobacter monicus]|uniref:Opacity protein-like surface antigen n=2 Tax=Roseinatronobacter monicus TaxID=393481 RepID=A0A543KFJ5_9RHOB|nr:opacity protein-like surface antigen [Roseinatronobacter monicus]
MERDMTNSHRTYLSGTALVIALALPTTVLAGGKMGEIEPVVVTPPAPMTQPMTWTGFYGGLGVGYGRGVSSTDISRNESEIMLFVEDPSSTNQSFNPSVSGFIGSARLGYDVQRGNFVFGGLIEGTLGKISGSDSISAELTEPDGPRPASLEGREDVQSEISPSNINANASYSNLMSVAVRGGPLINDGNTLLYGRLGLSRAKLEVELPDANGSSTGTGVNVGLGAEHLLTESISVFAEYNFHDVGTSFSVSSGGNDWDVKGKGLHTVSMGVNFRF